MTDPVNDLAHDIRAIDGDHDLGAGELAEALIALGWVKQPVLLSRYKPGQTVSVFHPPTGDWLPGHVSSTDMGMVHVDTEKGPVTVMNITRISPLGL